MDQVGCHLTPMVGTRKGSPAAREDRLSFFKEISQEQLASYRPEQVAHILRQRENVQLVIQRDKVRKNSAAILSRLAQPYGLDSASCTIGLQKPWLCSPQEECQYRVCQNCRPGCADRAFLSLNAVADGEVPPTAAAGYSFHLLGERPVVNARAIVNIGCRPVPLITRGRLLWARRKGDAEIEEYDADFDWSLTPAASGVASGHASGHLKYSPGCENLGVLGQAPTASAFAPRQWTPPPSPVNDTTEGHTARHFRELSIDESNEAATGSSHSSSERFPPSPLKVPHGVAMLEESVELGVPDVVTQA
ncbi:hypothetical protein Trco_008345 [Trichoderma cornu-damae]|uniref:Uncharacterized protein n=1 Tax=Trichoderma cornu-damae TaxID=654480 RepID=A0A9P8QIK6_9HYPO|nr:hypothetical protein Trco_008345 [Trichoderma cornu-damae]